jgi:hypothetical protein
MGSISLIKLDLRDKCIQKIHTLKNNGGFGRLIVDSYEPTTFALGVCTDIENNVWPLQIYRVKNDRIVAGEFVEFELDMYFQSYYDGSLYSLDYDENDELELVSIFYGSI